MSQNASKKPSTSSSDETMTGLKILLLVGGTVAGMLVFGSLGVPPRFFAYLMVGLPAFIFLGMYLAEFKYVEVTRESAYMFTLVGSLGLLGMEIGIRNTFFPGVPPNRIFIAATLIIVAGCLWDLVFFLSNVKSARRKRLRQEASHLEHTEGPNDGHRDGRRHTR